MKPRAEVMNAQMVTSITETPFHLSTLALLPSLYSTFYLVKTRDYQDSDEKEIVLSTKEKCQCLTAAAAR